MKACIFIWMRMLDVCERNYGTSEGSQNVNWEIVGETEIL
jgi:hypothetical protein